ncbi:MAG TPA: hypothetical protein VGB42_00645 [Candidatus Thermoplasmatota archaeon]
MWFDLAVRVVRAALVGLAIGLLAMLGFSVLEAIGDLVAERSVAADDPNPYAVQLLPIGVVTGIGAGLAVLTWPAPRRPAFHWSAWGVRALAAGGLVTYLTTRIAGLVAAIEGILAPILGGLTATSLLLVAWERRPLTPPTPPGPPVRPVAPPPASPSQAGARRRGARRP